MPVRIYSLAKEVNVDSKELVDICNRIGITGKGSALASLDDDEAERIRKHLAGTGPATATEVVSKAAGGNAAASSPPVPIRPTVGSRIGIPPKIILTTPSTAAAPPAVPISAAAPTPATIPAPLPMPTSVPTPTTTPTPTRSRDDVMSPSASTGKVRVIGSRSKSSAPSMPIGTSDDRKKRKDFEPVINLARIPKTATSAAPSKASEPAPQKPEIKLTKDLIVGTKQGMKAPLDQFVQQENQKSGKPAVAGTGGLSQFKAAAEKAARTKKTVDEDESEAGKGKKGGLAGLAASRAERSKRRSKVRPEDESRDDEGGRRDRRTLVRRGGSTTAPRKEKVTLELPCSVRSFSEAAGVPAARVLRSLMTIGVMVNINATLEIEQAMLLATELGVDIDFKEAESLEENLLGGLDMVEDQQADLVSRPPIVTFLGHVDHGKTSLLDYLIGTKIVSGEAGGITQHIRAYQVKKDGRAVAFVDTPGHEAFTEMRARGANVTDIAVLVIAADDGIMPQTVEAISHAKAANVPMVVALNKSDLVGADANRVMTQMTEHGLTPSEWGGEVEVVKTSAITGLGMDELLETLLTVAEIHEFKANPKRAAIGVCLESEQESNRGAIAKVMVQNGTLRVGDVVVCGNAFGKVKALYDTLHPNKQLTEAGPSMPVNVTGLDIAPEAGERFYVIDDIAQARQISSRRENQSRAQSLSGTSQKVSFAAFQELLQSGRLGQKEERVVLNLIIRADVRGSLEAIDKELLKLDHPEVDIRILQRSVGGISLADVTLASASDAVIVGFNVIPDDAARALADDRKVEIRRYDIIYNLTNDIKAILEGRLKPEKRVVELGRALVKQVFTISRVGTIAGCYVAQGTIERGCRIRVNRDGRTIGDYALDTLKRIKDDVKEVPRGMECGIKLSGFNDMKQDDILEAYKIEEFARTLESSSR